MHSDSESQDEFFDERGRKINHGPNSRARQLRARENDAGVVNGNRGAVRVSHTVETSLRRQDAVLSKSRTRQKGREDRATTEQVLDPR